MPCVNTYLCNCGSDETCRESLTETFGSLVAHEDEGVDIQSFRNACNFFGKFVTGFCKDFSSGIEL